MVEMQIARRGLRDERVLAALRAVPRHRFVPEDLRDDAYRDCPLPIGYGQTISQPYIVALMSSLAAPRADDQVLDVGTGSGYQAAVLAEMGAEVWSIERLAPLAEEARTRLRELRYDHVHLATGDGSRGWPEHAPYSAILAAAAPRSAPPALLAQLAVGGRLVLPLGAAHQEQVLTVYERREDGYQIVRSTPCRFVPLVAGSEGVTTASGVPGADEGGDVNDGERAREDTMKSVRANVRGRVQGVYFRASAQREARRLGVRGWARNLNDGSVELHAEGERAAVDALLTWCASGPAQAEVERVEVDDTEPEPGLVDFAVR
jgi:protein-L-isoaspartate(D-aspartate) O-methyltransferase